MEDEDAEKVLQAYIIFREHWELIDRVFLVESPKGPSRAEIVTLGSLIFNYARISKNEILYAMFRAIDALALDTYTEEELEEEKLVRELCREAIEKLGDCNYKEMAREVERIRASRINNSDATA
ncbi:hypothetical protein MUK70_12890 [Dyadobacter chenwenxiniae]|uniref:Uncharacterized protein n=1 Tax=Dyadobacter chenwenxiniae TaxID=2906456 RepID=A0A9X1PJX6_9BACT|nr:hypothetical protein [Dyadobacter chenwenxiniae]MCF0060141.1 hypothetical protein [Dyadobacter chenwenxiniae]UON85878.1 hypothetical protein MUK70_12890 [Dyadobacter chenwenxiniae]